MNLAQALFAPRAVALIGASGDAAKNTARPQRYLRKHGYAGRILPINPGRGEVLGEAAYPSLAAAPGEVDHAFIMVADVERALEDCGAKRVPVASIYSDGFADQGNFERQLSLAKRAKALGIRLLGPNSMGVIDARGGLALTVNAVLEMERLPAGGVSIVSQSGTMLGTVLSRGAARGLGFAKLVSVGNEADLGVGELVELLAADADTRVILLFLETIRDAARLAAAARRTHAAGKAVAAYKLGRSALGESLARSHTGALAGSDAALDAYFRDCGIVRVDLLETFIEISPLLVERKPPDLRRPGRVAVVSTTGGGAATVVDRLGLRGIELASMHDLTMAATRESYRATLERLRESPDCDAVLAVVGSSAQFHPQLAVQPILQCARAGKPVAAFMTPHAEASLALCAQHGVPAFRTPEACADALAAFLSWQSPGKRPAPSLPESLPENPFELFAALGVPVAPWQIAEPPAYAHNVPYPVAVKLAGVAHKTEKAGVVLNVQDRAQLDAAVKAFDSGKVLIQKMETGLAEAIVGYRDDPVVGPLVLVGAGGVLSEIYRDFAVRVAPVSPEEAAAMIAEVKGFAPLRGYRNLPRGDLAALAQAVARVSALALAPGIAEAEINPLLVKSQGVVAVDALVVGKE
ncbi:MAG TPA: acetate--CoA ligase family protein [Burkholderiales bacterium]